MKVGVAEFILRTSSEEQAEFCRRFSDMQELVRCERCIYWQNDEVRANQTAWLPCMKMKTDKYWFCGSAKRKEPKEEQ